MDGETHCFLAFEYLERNEVETLNRCRPSSSPALYIPARKIKELFNDKIHGLSLETIFLCRCNRCERDGGSVDDRSPHYNVLKQKELRGEYALIYALLIYIRRPGLIAKFQRHQLKLEGTTYLNKMDLQKLNRENISDPHTLQRKLLEKQYSFLVRTLRPFSDIIDIPSEELLPIDEAKEPKGEGSFAEVRCFVFQDDEYRCKEFGQVHQTSVHLCSFSLTWLAHHKIRSQDFQTWFDKSGNERME